MYKRDEAHRIFKTYFITIFNDYLRELVLQGTYWAYQDNPNQQFRAVGHTNL